MIIKKKCYSDLVFFFTCCAPYSHTVIYIATRIRYACSKQYTTYAIHPYVFPLLYFKTTIWLRERGRAFRSRGWIGAPPFCNAFIVTFHCSMTSRRRYIAFYMWSVRHLYTLRILLYTINQYMQIDMILQPTMKRGIWRVYAHSESWDSNLYFSIKNIEFIMRDWRILKFEDFNIGFLDFDLRFTRSWMIWMIL